MATGTIPLQPVVAYNAAYAPAGTETNVTLPAGRVYLAVMNNAYYGMVSVAIITRHNASSTVKIVQLVTDSHYTWTAVDLSTFKVKSTYAEANVFLTRLA